MVDDGCTFLLFPSAAIFALPSLTEPRARGAHKSLAIESSSRGKNLNLYAIHTVEESTRCKGRLRFKAAVRNPAANATRLALRLKENKNH